MASGTSNNHLKTGVCQNTNPNAVNTVKGHF